MCVSKTKLNLKKLRIEAQINQDSIALACGVDRATVSKWESGDFFPRAELLPKIADKLGCTIDELFKQA